MLVPAVTFFSVILALHILVVVAAFGVLVAFPLISQAAERFDARVAPALHNVRLILSRSLINPGLVIVLAAGIYLAAKLPTHFHPFYVQWGIGAVIVLGALEGAVMTRSSKQLAELAKTEVEAAGDGEIKWSPEYVGKRGRADLVAVLMAVIVLATVVLMTVQ